MSYGVWQYIWQLSSEADANSNTNTNTKISKQTLPVVLNLNCPSGTWYENVSRKII
jgi:hypothetical protein